MGKLDNRALTIAVPVACVTLLAFALLTLFNTNDNSTNTSIDTVQSSETKTKSAIAPESIAEKNRAEAVRVTGEESSNYEGAADQPAAVSAQSSQPDVPSQIPPQAAEPAQANAEGKVPDSAISSLANRLLSGFGH